jgi:hypothetical protein
MSQRTSFFIVEKWRNGSERAPLGKAKRAAEIEKAAGLRGGGAGGLGRGRQSVPLTSL